MPEEIARRSNVTGVTVTRAVTRGSELDRIHQSVHDAMRENAIERFEGMDQLRRRVLVVRAKLSPDLSDYGDRVRGHLERRYEERRGRVVCIEGVIEKYDKDAHAKDEWTLRCLRWKDDQLGALLTQDPNPPIPRKPGQKIEYGPDGVPYCSAERCCYRAEELLQRAQKEADAVMRKVEGR